MFVNELFFEPLGRLFQREIIRNKTYILTRTGFAKRHVYFIN